MATSLKYARRAPVHRPSTPTTYDSIRYWLIWTLIIAVFAVGINAYFDFRNRELDKRLEQISISFRHD